MATPVSTVVRFGALLAAGAFGVHQLRYLLAYGHDVERELHTTGHGYLTVVEPLIGLALAFAVGQLVASAARGRTFGVSRRRLALVFAAALLAIYTGQELVEGALNPGHPAGLRGVFGDGGWLAVPLALVGGALLAATVRVVGEVGERARLRGLLRPPRTATAAAPPARPALRVPGVRRAPLASRSAGRAPPRLLIPPA